MQHNRVASVKCLIQFSLREGCIVTHPESTLGIKSAMDRSDGIIKHASLASVHQHPPHMWVNTFNLGSHSTLHRGTTPDIRGWVLRSAPPTDNKDGLPKSDEVSIDESQGFDGSTVYKGSVLALQIFDRNAPWVRVDRDSRVAPRYQGITIERQDAGAVFATQRCGTL